MPSGRRSRHGQQADTNVHHALMMCKLCSLFTCFFFGLNVYKQISGFKFCAQYLMAFPVSKLFTVFFFFWKQVESIKAPLLCVLYSCIFSVLVICINIDYSCNICF